jgi:hypothetical protein
LERALPLLFDTVAPLKAAEQLVTITSDIRRIIVPLAQLCFTCPTAFPLAGGAIAIHG